MSKEDEKAKVVKIKEKIDAKIDSYVRRNEGLVDDTPRFAILDFDSAFLLKKFSLPHQGAYNPKDETYRGMRVARILLQEGEGEFIEVA